VTLRITGLVLHVLSEGEVISKLPRGPANEPGIDDEVEVDDGGGVNMGDGDAVGVGEVAGKEFSP
jgi:hypothetical protein